MTTSRNCTPREIAAMKALREHGFTLQGIAMVMNRSITTVYFKTLSVPHENRHEGDVLVDKQTGAAVAA